MDKEQIDRLEGHIMAALSIINQYKHLPKTLGSGWIGRHEKHDGPVPVWRPRMAAVSILARKSAFQITLNCHAVKECTLTTSDTLGFKVDREDGTLQIRVEDTGFPINLHKNSFGEVNGYQVASMQLINVLHAKGVPLNKKIPLEFDASTKTWTGKLADALPIPARDVQPKQQALL